jgi:hypothetical protein
MLDGFTTQHNDKRLTTVGIDIGHGMTKTLNQLGTPFLHGKPSMNYYSLKVYFYSFIGRAQGAISQYFLVSFPGGHANTLHFIAFSG